MEDLGIGIALGEFQAFLPNGGPVPELGDEHDLATANPYELIARLLAHIGGYNEIGPRIHNVEKAAKLWDVDGILWWYPATCRPAGDAPFIKGALEKRTGLPVGLIEGDLYDSRNYNL
jgi:benzoyl-CoA reductase/2-hydroxyglutaryl-CoA dehydratase subunit BcrC/BadD/HgdB